ncbi:unnamed protein product [Trifolium pratense]|uniref:Uncharacterized protein n=1 Tax=Trifolium pratense TaxID=57577 RepID=A0ACB0IK89_TRIPR|nr:unnamed protein product [Trifolium pratense]
MATFVFSANKEPNGGDPSKPPDDGSSKNNRVSFRDMVMGDKIPSATREKKDLFKENLAKIVFEDDNPQKPMVHIDESVFCKVAVVQTSSSSSQESQRSPANIAVTAAEKNPPSANGGADNVTDRNQINGPAKVSEQNQESIYGDWLIVKRKSRTSKSNNNNKTAPLSNGKKKLNDQFKNGKNHANGNIESSQNEHAFNSHKATKFPSKNCMATPTNKDINRIQPKRQRNDDTPNLDLPHTNSLVKDEINKKKRCSITCEEWTRSHYT